MFALPKRFIYEALAFLLLGSLCMLAVSGFVALKERKLLGEVVARVGTTRDALRALNSLTKNNQADSGVDAVLRDCGLRDEYEKRLGDLARSDAAELGHTKILFFQCGDFYALRKSWMVEKMRYTVSELEDVAALSASYTGIDRYKGDTDAWNAIITLERERSQLMAEQVTLQGTIIDTLGARQNFSDELHRAEEIGQLLDVKAQQAKTLATEEELQWSKVTAVK